MKLSELLGCEGVLFAPASTASSPVKWVDLQNFDAMIVAYVRTKGTGAITLEIQGSESADGSGAKTIVSKTFDAGQPDAINDNAFIEMVQNDVLRVGEGLRYFSPVITNSVAGDEGTVFFVKGKPLHCHEGLTKDLIA